MSWCGEVAQDWAVASQLTLAYDGKSMLEISDPEARASERQGQHRMRKEQQEPDLRTKAVSPGIYISVRRGKNQRDNRPGVQASP